MSHKRLAVILVSALLVAGGVATGAAVAVGGSHSSGMMRSDNTAGSLSSYYRSMMGNFRGSSMMGGSSGLPSYAWMMGGRTAPGWMRGGTLPTAMMGTSTDPGNVMGRLFANAPGSRLSPAEATRLGNQAPAGASVDAAQNRITFSGPAVHLVALASPAGGPAESFRIAGLINPTVAVTSGQRVSIEVVNADPKTAHGLVIVSEGSRSLPMPMMTARPAFAGSALWFLGDPTAAGLHAGTLSFTATTPGTYQYLCPMPGHAKEGMVGTFVVAGGHGQ